MSWRAVLVGILLASCSIAQVAADVECFDQEEKQWLPEFIPDTYCRDSDVPQKYFYFVFNDGELKWQEAVDKAHTFATGDQPVYFDFNGNNQLEASELVGHKPHMMTVETEEDYNFLTGLISRVEESDYVDFDFQRSWVGVPAYSTADKAVPSIWLAARGEKPGPEPAKIWKWTDGPATGEVFWNGVESAWGPNQYNPPSTSTLMTPGGTNDNCVLYHQYSPGMRFTSWGCPNSLAWLLVEFEPYTGGGSEGDPHVTGFLGQKFDFTGIADKVFAWYSDIDAQINFKLGYNPEDGRIYQTEVGVRFGKDVKLMMSLEPKYGLAMQPFDAANQTLGYSLVLERRTPTQGSQKYQHLDFAMSPYLRSTKEYVHGILGQTYRPSQPVPGTLMAEGVLEGPVESYIVQDGILGTKWAFNRFNGTEGAYTPAQCAALLKSPRVVPRLLGSSTGGTPRV